MRLAFTGPRGPVLRCPGCGLFRVTARSEEAADFYAAVDEPAYKSYFGPFRKRQYEDALRALGLPGGASLLDVGASYGWLVEVALDLGLDARGIEPGGAEAAPAVAGRILRQPVEEYALDAAGTFDAVTMWHVLEHLADPSAALRRVRGLLRPGGRLLVAVPNAEGRLFRAALVARRLGRPELVNALFYFGNPNLHRFYFTRASLEKLMAAEGLEPMTARAIESFDWERMHLRARSAPARALLRVAGRQMGRLGFTRRENLVVTARRADA